MDYEKKYKEALEWARKVIQGKTGFVLDEVLEKFPELKESEDERIRKAILELVRQSSEVLDKQNQNNMIAWLEKQKVLTAEEDLQGKEYVLWCIKQAKKYAKDENEMGTCWLAEKWLEKQGEQKDFAPKVGDWIIRSAEGFKHNIYFVTEVEDYYVCEELNGRQVTFTFNDVHQNFKLWDISDAKDGDILCAKGNYSKEYLFMFSSFTEDNVISTHFGYNIFHGTFGKKITRFGREKDFMSVTPATKEQRNTLMKAMIDAGYTFDFDKKELKKVEE